MKLSQFKTHTKKAGQTMHGVHIDTIQALIRFQRRTGVDPERIIDFITLADQHGLADKLEIGPEIIHKLRTQAAASVLDELKRRVDLTP